ncbi:MAG: hypothetical protein ACK2T0_14215 [Anaerolineales bacterium]
MALAAIVSASQHFHAAQTDLITPGSPSEALSRGLHLPRRSVQYGFTRRLRDGKNHIYCPADTRRPTSSRLAAFRTFSIVGGANGETWSDYTKATLYSEIKAVLRAGIGSCGCMTCTALFRRLFRDEGVPEGEIADRTVRPLFIEVPLGVFAGARDENGDG